MIKVFLSCLKIYTYTKQCSAYDEKALVVSYFAMEHLRLFVAPFTNMV